MNMNMNDTNMKTRPQGCDFLAPGQCPLCLGDGSCHWPPEPEPESEPEPTLAPDKKIKEVIGFQSS